jgi:predicted peroxiredoxin
MSFMEAYKMTGEAKVEGVKEFMENLIDNGVKFLLFAHH